MKEAMEKDLQSRLDEIRDVARRLAAAKESYKDAFSSIDLLATELEQKRHLKGLKNGGAWEDDFSQFQEIDDIGMSWALVSFFFFGPRPTDAAGFLQSSHVCVFVRIEAKLVWAMGGGGGPRNQVGLPLTRNTRSNQVVVYSPAPPQNATFGVMK